MDKHGAFVWNELMTRDVEAAKSFYGATLGWSFDGMAMPEGGTYWVAVANGAPAGGIMDISDPEYGALPPHWFAYIAVDDVDALVAEARRHGGQLKRPIFDVPDVGRIAIVEDPTGAVVGLMTPTRP